MSIEAITGTTKKIDLAVDIGPGSPGQFFTVNTDAPDTIIEKGKEFTSSDEELQEFIKTHNLIEDLP